MSKHGKVLHLLSGGGAGGIESLCEQIGFHGSLSHEFCFLYSKGEIYDRMKEEGIAVHDLTACSFMGKCNGVVRIARYGAFDALVVHHEGAGIYLIYEQLMRRYKGAKYIKYLHRGYEPEYMYSGDAIKDGLHHFLLGKTLKDSDVVVSVSNAIKKGYIDEYGINEDKIRTVYNGIELEDGDAKAEHGSGLLYIGRLAKVKGVDVLLRAMAVLKHRGVDVHLDILGDGPNREEFEGLSNELGVYGMVTFHGTVTDKERKEKFYRDNSVFVYPPVWQEAFGISIVEALSKGLICVASKTGGIPEVIDRDDVGILFENGNSEACADAIVKAMSRSSGEDGLKYHLAGVKRAADFDIKASVRGLEILI